MKDTIRAFWRLFGKYRNSLIILTALGFLGALLEGIGINSIVPMLTFFTGNSGLPTDFISQTMAAAFHLVHVPFTFRYLLAFILLLFFTRAIFMVIFGYIRGWINADFLSNESEAVLRGTLFASWPYLLGQKLGMIQNSAVRDVQQSSALLSMQVQLIQSGTGLLMYLLVAFNISPLMTGMTLIAGGVLLFIVRPLLKRTNTMATETALIEKDVTQFISEHIIGMKIVKASGTEARAAEVGRGYMQRMRALSIRMAGNQSIGSSLSQPFILLFIVILLLITYKSGSFSIVSFAAILYLIQKMFTYLDSAQTSLQGIAQTAPYMRNLLRFKESLAAHKEEDTSGTKPFVFAESIDFENVSLSYVSDRAALSGISFSIKQGMTLGLIGPSGAGKTSFADLLLRLFTPTEGRITLDGVDANAISLSKWRENVGYVPQDVFLLNGTIEDNIRFYRPKMTRETIVEAARQANIHDFIESLPLGYATVTGDRGVMISGGQRQRIALARALAGRPALLVLDEATSALDNESERLIQEAITSLRGAITVVIIAHRLSTIEHADELLVLQNGRITESGSPAELHANPNSYLSRHTDLS